MIVGVLTYGPADPAKPAACRIIQILPYPIRRAWISYGSKNIRVCLDFHGNVHIAIKKEVRKPDGSHTFPKASPYSVISMY